MKASAVVFDLDDTLLRDDLTISGFTVDVLREAASKGIRIIPASGRARDSMRGFVEKIGCAACYIACNGAEIWAPDHSLLMRKRIAQDTALEIAAFAEERGCYIQTYEGASFYYNREGEYARAYAASSMLSGVYVGPLAAFLREHETGKMLLMDQPERVAAMLTEAQTLFGSQISVTCSKPWFLEFNPPGANKGAAVRWCGERFDFSTADTVAFGDSLNDMSMLTSVGLGVAMANARPDVLSAIPTVCRSNQEDGVACFIREHLL